MKQHKRQRSEHCYCSPPSARELANLYLGSSNEGEESWTASHILEGLEAENSALAGVFRSFMLEAGIKPASHTSHVVPRQPFKRRHQSNKLPDTELLLTVTLEDLYNGATKWVPVQLQKHDGLGHVVPVQEQLPVRVQPGIQEGTRITLPGLGNEDSGGNSSDLTFIVQEQLHPAFRRLKDDLYTIVNVPLVTALTGGPIGLKTLNGQMQQLPVGDSVIMPGSELVLANQGMPVFGDSTGRRGALHVKFQVSFPQQLSEQQQALLRHTLAGCEFVSGVQRLPVLASLPSPGLAQQQHRQHHRATVHVQFEQVQQKQASPQRNHAQMMRQCTAASAVSSGSMYHSSCAGTAAAAVARAAAATAGQAAAAMQSAAAGSSAAGSAGSSSIAGVAGIHSTGTSNFTDLSQQQHH